MAEFGPSDGYATPAFEEPARTGKTRVFYGSHEGAPSRDDASRIDLLAAQVEDLLSRVDALEARLQDLEGDLEDDPTGFDDEPPI